MADFEKIKRFSYILNSLRKSMSQVKLINPAIFKNITESYYQQNNY